MAGEWASALGAAILGGNSGYRQAKQDQLQRQQELLHNALLKKQLNEFDTAHAGQDLQALTERYGPEVYDMPVAVQAAQKAGMPFQIAPQQTMQSLTRARMDQVERGTPMGSTNVYPADADEKLADNLHISPVTGAFIPEKARMERTHQRRQEAVDQALTNFMQDELGGSPPEHSPSASKSLEEPGGGEPPFRDPAEVRRYMAQKAAGIAAIEPAESGAHKLWMSKQMQEQKAEIPGPMMQRVVGGMNETVSNLRTAQAELEKMYPGIGQVDISKYQSPTDAPYNGIMAPVKAAAWRWVYGHYDSPYNKAIQAAALGNVQEWASLVPGRINRQIIDKIAQHQGEFGQGQSPLATYGRNRELIDMLERNRQDLLTPVRASAPQAMPAQPGVPAAGGPAPASAPGEPVKTVSMTELLETAKQRKPNDSAKEFQRLFTLARSQGVTVTK